MNLPLESTFVFDVPISSRFLLICQRGQLRRQNCQLSKRLPPVIHNGENRIRFPPQGNQPFEVLAIDFITSLPVSDGHDTDTILTVTHKSSKLVLLIARQEERDGSC
ncbi:uncharacterized protein BDCG_06568 [Blastomyces dermatitidis ER-3]|uniref:Uncharacterized protein n=2 Tax=Ajellomyces dermatitidis TaxID=5039 RepID=F2TAR4_AJEDA|nr:uncharacterized protein BDCG_06568 [Blastomyces dermatitidis ER-3]EEQ91448.2 hypothetical protein BDCG_06568 [Blastomyces dermatitidis ER-3]EGE80327.1 hypothetical protein BDDG_03268 [Blastomyces dermatitidis ATCC 18188]